MNRNISEWNKEFKINYKWFLLGGLITLMLLFGGESKAHSQQFNLDAPVTMTVVKIGPNGTGGGTWKCPSVQSCYIKVLEAEARNATADCHSIEIKRGANIVWSRYY